jgi:type VI protein secretion system component VasK
MTEAWGSLLNTVRSVLLLDLAIFILVGLVCLVGGWHTLHDYASGLAWAGGVALVVGLSSILGGWEMTRSAMYQYGQTASEESASERVRRELSGEQQRFGFLAQMGFVAVVAFLCAIGIEVLAP